MRVSKTSCLCGLLFLSGTISLSVHPTHPPYMAKGGFHDGFATMHNEERKKKPPTKQKTPQKGKKTHKETKQLTLTYALV